jgi:pimeloyl-ACP methyl ester carboxylesterase
MKVNVPAVVGGVVGIAAAAAATGLAVERRQVNRSRAAIEPGAAARLGVAPVDRECVLHTADGVDLHIEEVGSPHAPLTVVFVHGYTLNLLSFHYQRHALAKRFGDQIRMVFYDQRSHGRSSRSTSAACTVDQLGSDLYHVIQATAPTGPIVLVGHSMGGMTIMALAEAHPELFRAPAAASDQRSGHRVTSIALVNTSPGNLRSVTLGLPSFLARLSAPVLPLVLRRAVKNAELVEKSRMLGKDLAWMLTKRLSFASKDVAPEVVAFATNMIAATRVEVVADFFNALMSHDGTMGLMNIAGCNVLVIGADSDAMTPLSHSETIAAALPHERFVVVPNAGHLVMLERPSEVTGPLAELVSEALADAQQRATGTSGRVAARARR